MERIELVFAAYAAAQASRARALSAAHRRGVDGHCQTCGEPHPCDLRRYAGELKVHFEQWLPPEEAESAAGVDNPTEAGQDSIHGTR